MNPSIVWFRHDLRLEDNPAFEAAAEQKGPVIPVFIWSPGEEGDWKPGEAANWWLHHSLANLNAELQEMGLHLIIREGESLPVLQQLIRETDAASIFWNRRYEPAIVARDAVVKSALHEMDIYVESFNASLLFEPWEIENQQKKPFKVFTPFWNHYLEIMLPPVPEPKPKQVLAPAKWPISVPLKKLELEPFVDWTGGLQETWTPGAKAAKKRLQHLLDTILLNYSSYRDCPGIFGTSHLSPYLHFGDIGPRQIWYAVQDRIHGEKNKDIVHNAWAFLRQLVWREFAFHLLFHFPNTTDQPLREEFESFPWKADPHHLKAWQKGQTGYPAVDAGMRELWHCGWMHNRIRMVVASFLVKDLLIPWQQGAKWFWDTLVDADLANNTLGWQWTAGCGADAAPYFRIFNPTLQGEKFDPDGVYVRKWVPELAKLPNKWIHHPWQAPIQILHEAGVELGKTYPYPIVDHAHARDHALQGYATIRNSRKENILF